MAAVIIPTMPAQTALIDDSNHHRMWNDFAKLAEDMVRGENFEPLIKKRYNLLRSPNNKMERNEVVR